MLIQSVPLGLQSQLPGHAGHRAGATAPVRPQSEFFNAQDSLSTNVNGHRGLPNNVQLEGVDDNHKTGLLTGARAVGGGDRTVSISTEQLRRRFGRAGGAITNVTLKSGTNSLQRQSAFVFGNTEATNGVGDTSSHLRPDTKVSCSRRHARRAR
jgi:hypothetical protein